MNRRIIPRTELGLPPRVTNVDRVTSRPRLARNLNQTIIHYTGVNRRYKNADLAQSVQAIHRWRANEYNYVIHQDGRVAEFAGEFQAAHCKGRNQSAYGVLFLNGIGEPATDAQVASFRWLMDVLRWVGAVSPNVWIVPHKWVAATSCPGDVMDRYDELVAR